MVNRGFECGYGWDLLKEDVVLSYKEAQRFWQNLQRFYGRPAKPGLLPILTNNEQQVTDNA